MKRVSIFILSFWALIALVCWLNSAHAAGAAVGALLHQMQTPPGTVILHAADDNGAPVTKPAASDHQPPRFLSAVAVYRNNRFAGFSAGKTFFLSCREALEDTQTAVAKGTEKGLKVIGLCIPIPTYDPADLAEGMAPALPDAPDNQV